MDIQKYVAAKDKGSVQLKKYGQEYALQMRQFDPATGEEMIPANGVINRAQIQGEKDRCEQNLAALNAILADMDALDKK